MFEAWGQPIGALLLALLAGMTGAWFGRAVLVRRRLSHRLAEGRSELSARTLQGEHPGLSRRWRGYVATPTRGHLDLRRFLAASLGTASLPVTSIEPATRRARGLEIWSIDPSCAVLTLRTPDGAVELAVLPDHVAWLTGRLGSDSAAA